MFEFVSGPRFGRQAAIRLFLRAVLTVGFPFLVYGLIVATHARSVGGAAGAVAVVAGVYLKPIILGVFLIAMLSPCWRRMRGLGLPACWGLFIPFLFLMDGAFFIVAALSVVVAWLTILSRRDGGSANSGPRSLAPSPAPTLQRVEFGR